MAHEQPDELRPELGAADRSGSKWNVFRYFLPNLLLDLPHTILQWRNRPTHPTWHWLGYVVAAFFIGSLASGITGNAGYDVLKSASPGMRTEVALERWLPLCGSALLAMFSILAYVRGRANHQLRDDAYARQQIITNKDQEIGRLTAQLEEQVTILRHESLTYPSRLQAKLTNIVIVHGLLMVELGTVVDTPVEKAVAWWTTFVERAFEHLCDVYERAYVNHGSVWLPCGDHEHLRISRGSRVHSESFRRRFYYGEEPHRIKDRGVPGTVFFTGEPLFVADIAHSELYIPAEGQRAESPGYDDVLAVPIGDKGRLGVLTLESVRGVFDVDVDQFLLKTIADILASALRLLDTKGVTCSDLVSIVRPPGDS